MSNAQKEQIALQLEIERLTKERDCYRILAATDGKGGFMPLHWREAVRKLDLDECRTFNATREEFARKLQERADVAEAKLADLEERHRRELERVAVAVKDACLQPVRELDPSGLMVRAVIDRAALPAIIAGVKLG